MKKIFLLVSLGILSPLFALEKEVSVREFFPEIESTNLNGEKKILPQGLIGDYKMLLIAFKREQQEDIDLWEPALLEWRKMLSSRPQGGVNLCFYEIPTIYAMNAVQRELLYWGMRQGVKTPEARARVYTIYTDKDKFKQVLGIKTEDDIAMILLDSSNRVLLKSSGKFDEQKKAHWTKFLEKLPPVRLSEKKS